MAGSAEENGAPFEAAHRLATAWRLPLLTEGSLRPESDGTPTVGGHKPRVIVLPVVANRAAAVLAQKFGGQLHAGCQSIIVRDTEIQLVRLLYRQRIQATVRVPSIQTPLVVTLHPDPAASTVPKVQQNPLAELLDHPSARLLRRFRIGSAELDLTEADVIVAGGRGVGDQRYWSLVEKLASTLNAAVAGSRVAMDAGWISRERMVGESGRAVAPKLYVAIGISGAPQHLSGIKNSQLVVAINKDRHAPIFRIANIGIVGDLHEVLPMLIERLTNRRGEGAEQRQH